jgi:CheY-like chemotaxis protein
MQQLKRVILIDDDEITNFIHQSLIEEMNITEEIICAGDGSEGIEILRKHALPPEGHIGVILLDLNMPGMNGLDFLDALREMPEHRAAYRVVIMTTSQNPKDKARVKQEEVAAYLNKPFRKEHLKAVLEA